MVASGGHMYVVPGAYRHFARPHAAFQNQALLVGMVVVGGNAGARSHSDDHRLIFQKHLDFHAGSGPASPTAVVLAQHGPTGRSGGAGRGGLGGNPGHQALLQ